MRRLIAVALATAPVLTASAGAAAAPSTGTARLQGQFAMSGRVTAARNVRGERAGQRVLRAWIFTPRCPTGACLRVGLARTRSTGFDSLILKARSPGYYVGAGAFYAPLRCGSRTYSRGQFVPFTVTVRITAAAVIGGVPVATQVSATYVNRSRANRTRCFAVLGHDAATYAGQLVSPTGGTGVVSDRSPAGS
jgi:hypothetical protein